MSPLLHVDELAGGYPGVDVFSGVGLWVQAGEILTILGANGSGKSALLETLQGLLRSRAGTIILDGQQIQHLGPDARARLGMSLVSDRRWLWNDMTVSEHLRVGAFRRAARPGWPRRAVRMQQLFAGLQALRSVRPAGLSGGLQQQLALARFGMSCPRLWLLDDPLQGLDEAVMAQVLDWIRQAAASGAAVIVTGQHIRALLGIGHRAGFLQGGTLMPLAAGGGGLRDPRVRALL